MAQAKGVVGYVRVASRVEGGSLQQERRDREILNSFVAAGGYLLMSVHVDRYGERRAGLPRLGEAIEASRRSGALLVVARGGPLLRDAAFFDALIAAACPFRVLDAPGLNPDTLASAGLRAYRSDLRGLR
jgi:hypothetical protein